MFSGISVVNASGYTNRLPLATDEDRSTIYNGVGFKQYVRLSSSGGGPVDADNSFYTTGFIPCSVGDVIRTKNISFTRNNLYIMSFNSSNVKVGQFSLADYGADLEITLDSSTFGSDFDSIRICGNYIGSDSIITVNEEIVDYVEPEPDPFPDAGATGEMVKTGTWTINYSDDSILPGETGVMALPDYEVYETPDGISITDWYYHGYFGASNILITDPDVYGYQIKLIPKTYNCSSKYVLSMRPTVGTIDEFASLKGVYGSELSSAKYGSTVWYPNNYAEQYLHLAVTAYMIGSDVEGSNLFPSISLSATFDYEIVAYTKAEFEQSIAQGIRDGNDLTEEGNRLQEEGNKLQEEANETSKGIFESIKEFFGSFFDNLISSIISIFVPSSEEMSALFDELNQFFSDTFGFLYYPFDFIITAFDVFLNSDSSTSITFPSFSIMGYEVWESQNYDLASDELVGTVFGYVRIGTGALLAMAFVNYLRNFFDKRFGGGGS